MKKYGYHDMKNHEENYCPKKKISKKEAKNHQKNISRQTFIVNGKVRNITEKPLSRITGPHNIWLFL